MKDLSVLITGGTGSFGQAFVLHALEQGAERVVVFSRDEMKQSDMRAKGFTDSRIRYFIGDVRDLSRLRRAMAGVDIVVHAAAMKQVVACEYNPIEAVATNIGGATNVIEAALDCGVSKVVALSTDKACDPTNLYGATKLVAEKLFADANVYSGSGGTRFSCVRYGNVLWSRGSVLPLFQAQRVLGEPLTMTDPTMTRFVVTLDQAVRFVSDSLVRMKGGEVFVPKLPAVTVTEMADAVSYPNPAKFVASGLRPGEKRHELLTSAHESPRVTDAGTYFVIGGPENYCPPVSDGFSYESRTAPRLSADEFRKLAGL